MSCSGYTVRSFSSPAINALHPSFARNKVYMLTESAMRTAPKKPFIETHHFPFFNPAAALSRAR